MWLVFGSTTNHWQIDDLVGAQVRIEFREGHKSSCLQ